MIRRAAALAALVVCSTAASASNSAVIVAGATRAQQCMNAAFAGSASRDALIRCNIALSEEALTTKNRAGTHVNRGVVLMNRRNYQEALADFDQAVGMSPDLAEALFNRGSAQLALGRYEEALDDINRGISLGLRQPEKAYYNRAIAREELQDARGAYLDYRQAARLKPEWELPRKELVRFAVTKR